MFRLRRISVIVCLVTTACVGQDTSNSAEELARLKRELQQTQSELADSKQQIQELRNGLEELRKQVQANATTGAQSPGAATSTSVAPAQEGQPTNTAEPTVAAADQNPSFLAAKIAELHQDKVESASRYPVKLSGLVLFNSYWNRGSVDIQDLPNLTFPTPPGFANGNVGATMRQTLLGVDATGPKIWGARSSASVSVDFGGGSPTTAYGVTAGLVRLRTADISLDWDRTSLHIGQDVPFFSPLSPTSYATVLEPAMAWSGNLWVWTPAVEIEHRLDVGERSSLVLQGGVLDPLTEEIPPFQGREPTAGESSRAPGIAGRIAIDRALATSLPFTLGVGGYYARQRYPGFDDIDSWTFHTDLKIPFGKRFEFSGEWYDGQAVGGLGGGIWASVIYPESTFPHSAIHPLRSRGGWAQLKWKPTRRFEINGAFGQDANLDRDLNFFPMPWTGTGFPAMKKNQTEFVNFIYEPTSFLLFALEYRHLLTAPAAGNSASGEHVNVAAGVRF
jgi:hypothetical protein